MNQQPGFGHTARMGLAWTQGLVRLFAAGSALFAAHQLFLRYYSREWLGIQMQGVNDCAMVDQIANGGLWVGQTFCNQPLNFVPWVELYRRHPVEAAIYYGVALAVILLIGLVIGAAYRKLGSRKPYGGSPTASAYSEHLR